MSTSPRVFYAETKIIFYLAVPLIASGIIEASINFFSTLLLAHLGTQELAAGALVSWLFFTLMVMMWGVLSAVSVMVAQRYGAKDNRGIATVLQDSLLFAAIMTLPTVILIWKADAILLYMGQKPEMVMLSRAYLHALAFGIFADFTFLVLQQFLIGLGHVRANMVFTFIWVPINIIGNYVLMFGKWGFPALGIAGIGWGTTISFWIMIVVIGGYILLQKDYQIYLPFKKQLKFLTTMGELLRIGIPMGAMFTVEIAFFFTLTLFMGHIGINELGANQIVMQYLGIFGMLIFSTAQAITVRVGHCLGAGDISKIIVSSYSGILVAVLFTSIAVLAYWFFPNFLIGLDLDPRIIKNQAMIDLAKQFFIIAAIFQWLEAIRFSLFGALRGIGDTTFTLWVSIILFWGLALPIGYFLAQIMLSPGLGYWWGLVIGTICGVFLLIWRLQIKIASISLNPLEKS